MLAVARGWKPGVGVHVGVGRLYEWVQRSGARIVVSLEDRWYRQDEGEVGNRQFIVTDPDGYLLRPFQSLGRRKLSAF